MTARSDIDEIRERIMRDMARVKRHVEGSPYVDPKHAELFEAWAGIETFVNVALRVFAKTNPSKIRSEALTVNIHSLLTK